MIRFIEMDENVTLADRLQKGGKDNDRRSVILRNKSNVKPDDVRGLLKAWAADAAQLHRAISGSCVFTNYAVWGYVEYFNQATSDPAFRSARARFIQKALLQDNH